MSVCQSVHHLGSDWNISTTSWWISVKFCTDIHGHQRMNPTDLPSSGQKILTVQYLDLWQNFYWTVAIPISLSSPSQSCYDGCRFCLVSPLLHYENHQRTIMKDEGLSVFCSLILLILNLLLCTQNMTPTTGVLLMPGVPKEGHLARVCPACCWATCRPATLVTPDWKTNKNISVLFNTTLQIPHLCSYTNNCGIWNGVFCELMTP